MTSQRSRNRLVERLREMGIASEIVLDTIRNTPRHIFVDEALASRAYDNTALPIGHNQTISQPYIVARMVEALLEEKSPATVLEVGTGCGYQTAILSRLVPKVYSLERIDALLNRARENFVRLGYTNIRTKHTDGNLGWPDYGPYEGIIVSAAPNEVPGKLLEQLAPGGRLVIPVGRSGEQELLSIVREESGYSERRLDWVSFVPMLEGID
ncbi:MAG: protein-L-isoaspartate O-methyltransferase [Gammaproteobacteria bacterium RIFCSPLOWO2_02_FULL_56_15]|nr:MAG: protein-L-isoaspartate O-methyltransferase [Gammaproteobacteria bacterium RIFCSPLOWO2_02_FULL_56_15]